PAAGPAEEEGGADRREEGHHPHPPESPGAGHSSTPHPLPPHAGRGKGKRTAGRMLAAGIAYHSRAMARLASARSRAVLAASACGCALLGASALRSPAPAQAAAADAAIQFEDATDRARLDSRNVFGGPGKPYIIESPGTGAAWIDYDGDGDIDLFVVNGSTLERQARGERGPGNRLYRNGGSGVFEDATAGS